MWDSGVVLAKLLEHAVDTLGMQLQGKKCIELGAGCGLTGYYCTSLCYELEIVQVYHLQIVVNFSVALKSHERVEKSRAVGIIVMDDRCRQLLITCFSGIWFRV